MLSLLKSKMDWSIQQIFYILANEVLMHENAFNHSQVNVKPEQM